MIKSFVCGSPSSPFRLFAQSLHLLLTHTRAPKNKSKQSRSRLRNSIFEVLHKMSIYWRYSYLYSNICIYKLCIMVSMGKMIQTMSPISRHRLNESIHEHHHSLMEGHAWIVSFLSAFQIHLLKPYNMDAYEYGDVVYTCCLCIVCFQVFYIVHRYCVVFVLYVHTVYMRVSICITYVYNL